MIFSKTLMVGAAFLTGGTNGMRFPARAVRRRLPANGFLKGAKPSNPDRKKGGRGRSLSCSAYFSCKRVLSGPEYMEQLKEEFPVKYDASIFPDPSEWKGHAANETIWDVLPVEYKHKFRPSYDAFQAANSVSKCSWKISSSSWKNFVGKRFSNGKANKTFVKWTRWVVETSWKKPAPLKRIFEDADPQSKKSHVANPYFPSCFDVGKFGKLKEQWRNAMLNDDDTRMAELKEEIDEEKTIYDKVHDARMKLEDQLSMCEGNKDETERIERLLQQIDAALKAYMNGIPDEAHPGREKLMYPLESLLKAVSAVLPVQRRLRSLARINRYENKRKHLALAQAGIKANRLRQHRPTPVKPEKGTVH